MASNELNLIEATAGGTLLLISIAGVIANLINAGTIVRNRKLRTTNNTFILNMTMADLIVSSTAAAISLPLVIPGYRPWMNRTYCLIQYYGFTVGAETVLVWIMLVGLNRCVFICHNQVYKSVFTKTITGAIIAGVWTMTGVIASLPLMAPNWFRTIEYQPRIGFCMCDDNCLAYMVIVCTYCGYVPMSISCYSYWKIFQTVYRSKQRTRTSTTNQNDIYKSILIVFGVYVVSQAPVAVIMADVLHAVHVDEAVFKLSYHLLLVNSAINPMVIGMRNPDFRPTYVLIGRWLKIHFATGSKGKVMPAVGIAGATGVSTMNPGASSESNRPLNVIAVKPAFSSSG